MTRNMTLKKFVRATRPTFLRAGRKIITIAKRSYQPQAPHVRSSIAQKCATPTVG